MALGGSGGLVPPPPSPGVCALYHACCSHGVLKKKLKTGSGFSPKMRENRSWSPSHVVLVHVTHIHHAPRASLLRNFPGSLLVLEQLICAIHYPLGMKSP